jgi:hypothetical protein
MRWISR